MTSGECGVGKPWPPTFEPSRLFIYTNELEMEHPGQPIADDGAFANDGCSLVATTGVCCEALMPYVVDASGHVTDFGTLPSAAAYEDAQVSHVSRRHSQQRRPCVGDQG